MLDASHSTGYHNSSFHISSVINFLFLIGSGLAIHQLETSTCCSVESSCNSHFSGDSVIAGHKMSLSQDESIVESYPSCVNTVGIRAVDSQSSHYRHKRPEQYAVITKTSTTSRDSFMTVSQGPPIGTYNLPTTFDKDSRHRRASASFLSNGRSTALLESNATHYKSAREECAKMNIGPGSYNVGYTWRPESPYEPSSAIIKSDLPTRSFSRDGQYERQWLVNKPIVPIITPREKQQNKADAHTDIESVKSLPSY